MKLHTTIKALCAALAFTAASAASAAPFYLDVGTDYSATDSNQACPTCTSVKNEFTYLYDSTTTVFDLDGNGVDAGDAVTTSIGLSVGPLTSNVVTGFNPNQIIGGVNSNNGYGTNWQLSFSVSNLQGGVVAVNGGVPALAYGPGLLDMFITFDGTTFNNFMDVNITGGVPTSMGTALFGVADFTNVNAGYNNLFHAADGANCSGATGFYDIWANCGPVQINFVAHQDTNVLISQFVPGAVVNGVQTYSVSTNHDGSGTLSVPEPASVALLAAGLLGLGALRRRKIN